MRGSKAEMIIAENAAMKAKIELLERMLKERDNDLQYLRQRLDTTQDALVACKSPEAYADLQNARHDAAMQAQDPEDSKFRDRREIETRIVEEHLENIESPLFLSAEDMFDKLMPTQVRDSEPLHAGDES